MTHGNAKTETRKAVLGLWAKGLAMTEIAARLGLTKGAVSGHVTRARAEGNPLARDGKSNLNRWTSEDDARLRDLLSQGMTQTSIGRVLGRSEAGVHARKRLLGLKSPRGRKVNTIANPDPVTRSHEKAIARMEAEEGGKLLTEIGRHDCRYPVGPESGAKQKFCGARKACGSSYCETHKARTLGRIIPPEAMEAEFAEAA